MWSQLKWVVENAFNILIVVVTTFFVLGSMIELFARLIPTKNPDSVLTRIGLKLGRFGTSLVQIGNGVRQFLDFIKIPNNRR